MGEDAKAEIFDRLNALETWKAEHGGRCDEKWKRQGAINRALSRRQRSHGRRLTKLERKVIFWTGAAATAGSLVGTTLLRLLE